MFRRLLLHPTGSQVRRTGPRGDCAEREVTASVEGSAIVWRNNPLEERPFSCSEVSRGAAPGTQGIWLGGGVPQPQQWGVTHAGSRSPLAFLSPSDCRRGCSDRFSAPNACQSPVSVKVKGLKVAAEILLNENRDRPRSWESTVWRETPWAGVRRRVSAALPGQGHLGAGGRGHGGVPESSHSTPSLSLPTRAPRGTPDGIAVRGPLTGIGGGGCRHGREALEIATLVVLV